MKKQLSIALAALVLVACGGGSSDNNLNNNLTGYWSGSFAGVVNSTPINGNVTMTLAQTDGRIKGIYSCSSGRAGTVTGSFDGATFTGDIVPTTANVANCPAKMVLYFSYNSLKGTSLTYNCAVTATSQVSFTKQ